MYLKQFFSKEERNKISHSLHNFLSSSDEKTVPALLPFFHVDDVGCPPCHSFISQVRRLCLSDEIRYQPERGGQKKHKN